MIVLMESTTDASALRTTPNCVIKAARQRSISAHVGPGLKLVLMAVDGARRAKAKYCLLQNNVMGSMMIVILIQMKVLPHVHAQRSAVQERKSAETALSATAMLQRHKRKHATALMMIAMLV